MRKRVKYIVIGFLLVLIAGGICWGNSSYNIKTNGIEIKNSEERPVMIEIRKKNIDKLCEKANGEVVVTADSKINYEYIFSGEVFNFENEKYYAAPIYRKSKFGLESQGYLFYDKNMKNIAIVTTNEKIYAADDEFITKIGNIK